MPILLIAAILGVVEGVTEFLPISSTGHLIVAEHMLQFHDVNETFTVVIQLAAILAVIWFYHHDLWQKAAGLFKRQPAALQFWKVLVIATIPAGIIGVLLDATMQRITKPHVVAWALIVGGIILWLADRPRKAAHRPTEPDLAMVTTGKALAIGLGQAVAILPGVSRSGATIVSGLYAGLDRSTATAFSFYLGIPVLLLASGYKVAQDPGAIAHISGGPAALFVAMILAFVTAFASVSWLLHYVSRHDFRPFAYYRIVLGILILLFL